MGSLFAPNMPSQPKAAPKAAPVAAAAKAASTDVTDAKMRNEEELRKRQGYASTIKAGETGMGGGSNVLG